MPSKPVCVSVLDWLLYEKPLSDAEGVQYMQGIAFRVSLTLYLCKSDVGKFQEVSLCLDWEICLLNSIIADLLSKCYWEEQDDYIYCRQMWNESVQ